MTAETTFLVFTNAVVPAWILLVVAPRWIWTQRLVHAFWMPAIIAGAYAIAIAKGIGSGPEGANLSTLSGLMLAFSNPWSALAGWLHYLAFDLFVGAWEVRDAQRRNLPHAWVCICLFFTLMFGPLGLGLYGLGRIVSGHGMSLVEETG